MQIAGEPTRVRLTTDLTRYHMHLTSGTTGMTIPNYKVGIWGTQDRFVAVKFDCCGATLDILWGGLDVLTEEEVLLREAVDRLRLELDTARDAATALRTLLNTTICEPCYLQDWADSSSCDCRCHADEDDARTTAQAALAVYDEAMGGK